MKHNGKSQVTVKGKDLFVHYEKAVTEEDQS